MQKGDIVRNNCQSNGNPYRHQIVVGVFNGGKSVRTILVLSAPKSASLVRVMRVA